MDSEELKDLVVSLKTKTDELAERERQLDDQNLEVRVLMEELTRRETKLLDERSHVRNAAQELQLKQTEHTKKKEKFSKEQTARARQASKDMAKWFNTMDPAVAAKRLLRTKKENETREERDIRYRDAAILLGLIEVEQAGSIVTELDQVDWVRIQNAKLLLTVKKKAKK